MNTRKERKTEENCLDILLNELPVEKVDMNKLLRKYVSLLIISYGEDVATEKLKGLIDDEENIFTAPSIILFDSYDRRVHDNKRAIEAYKYMEYGEIWFDDKLIRRDGVFVVKELQGLNPDKLK